VKLRTDAVLLVDVINPMSFPGAEDLHPRAMAVLPALRHLRRAARAQRLPVIYANDNFGHWEWSSEKLIAWASSKRFRGSKFVRALTPGPRDLFVLKPKNSAFYCTSLEPLLEALKVRRLLVAGLTGDNCVLFSAHDAYLRGLKVQVPADCVASESDDTNRRALEQMACSLKADVRPLTKVIKRGG
jgi:nicotinamidase-related amidase